MRRALFLGVTLIVLPEVAAPEAIADRPVPVANVAFEAAGNGALPTGWSLEAPLPAGAVVRKAEGGHGGAASIELGADERDGLYLALPSPFYRAGLSAWAVVRGEQVEQEGHFGPERFELAVR
jgi:hypothetical protein